MTAERIVTAAGLTARTESELASIQRTRALCRLSRNRGEPGHSTQFGPAHERDLLAWAATIPDEDILGWRNTGPKTLRWIREHQPVPSPPEPGYEEPGGACDGCGDVPTTTFVKVLKRTGWRVELFWNSGGNWFTARLVNSRGDLMPVEEPIGASGRTPDEALASLGEEVLEWA